MACISRTERSAEGDHFGWHPSTGPDVDERYGHVFVNNLLTADESYNKPLLNIWQRAMLCDKLTEPQVKELDYNVYVRKSTMQQSPLILWSPVKNEECLVLLDSPASLNKVNNQFEKNSSYFSDYNAQVFRSDKLGNYQLLQSFPGIKSAEPLPGKIKELLGLSENIEPFTPQTGFIGAYPPPGKD
jgi:hypothetical protein